MPLLHLAVLAAHRLLVRAAHRLLVVLVALKTQEAVAAQLVAAIVLAAQSTNKLGGEDVKVLRRFACEGVKMFNVFSSVLTCVESMNTFTS